MEHKILVKIVIESKGLKLFDSTSQNEIRKQLVFNSHTAMIEKESIIEFTDLVGRNRRAKVVNVQTEFYDKTQREQTGYEAEATGSGPFDMVVYYEIEDI